MGIWHFDEGVHQGLVEGLGKAGLQIEPSSSAKAY